MRNLYKLTSTVANLASRAERLEGREYRAYPIVMLVEGVHNRLYYSSAEIARSADSWNGVPLTLHHPSDGDRHVAANQPPVLERACIGRVFNARFADGKLLGEAWIDVEKARRLAPGLLEALDSGRQVELSTGLYGDDVGGQGQWNDEQYQASVAFIRPEHLAVLPGEVGACSWADGCGFRENAEEGGGMERMKEQASRIIRRVLSGVTGKARGKEYDAVQKALDNAAGENELPYVVTLSGSDITYQTIDATYTSESESAPPKTYLIKYEVDKDGNVILLGEAEEIHEERRYVPVSTGGEGDVEANKEGEDEKMALKQLVADLIACERCPYTQEDEEALLKMSEATLIKLVDEYREPENKDPETVQEQPKPEAEEEGEQKDEEEDEPKAQQRKTYDEWMAEAPPEVAEQVREAKALRDQMRDDLVKSLMKLKSNRFTERQLRAFETSTLRNLAAMSGVDAEDVKVNYALRRGGNSHENEERTVPEPPDIFAKA